MNITAPLRRLARLAPHAAAIIRADDSVVTYGALDRQIDAAAGRVLALGLRPGDVVGLAVTGPDESLSLTLLFALARLGIASADPALAAAHLRHRFTQGGDGYDTTWLDGAAAEVQLWADADATFRIFGSSGTTGAPKFAAISHALMAQRVFANWLAPGGGQARRMIGVNLGITWGLAAVLRTLWAGGTLVLSNPKDAAAAIRRHGVTVLNVSPGALRALVETLPDDAAPPPTLTTIEVGGSRLQAALHDIAAARLCPTIITYLGATEAGGIASAPFAALAGRPGAAGFVHADVVLEIADDADAPLPPGTEGRVRLRGPLTIAGYLDGPGENFRDGWFYTGDIGALWPDGMLTLAGRVGDLINSGGVKISPAVIEDVLLALPGVSEAVAFGVPDAYGEDEIWAAIVARWPIETKVLSALCARVLPGKTPRTILQVPALPRNTNGKVRRDMLVAFARQQRG